MTPKQKLKLFWKIINHLSKKFCENKIVISDISLFKEGDLHDSFPDSLGWYSRDGKGILIHEDTPLVNQIRILIHEFVHAWQWQIEGEYYKRMIKNAKKKEGIKRLSNKKYNKIIHDKKSEKIYNILFKETDKILKISMPKS
jgi:hypothetical protein